jgi:catechol 2,3-dioxygenase-like lactoylglutathione lyase family enzyme
MRLEIFVTDLERSTAFYTDVLGFTVTAGSDEEYRELSGHDTRIALQPIANLSVDHPLRRPGPLGLGLELVLEVANLEDLFEHVLARWPVEAGLHEQPWGLVDFRVLDPDGYYWRPTQPPRTPSS